jgi:predicted nucleotidyltransferase
MATAHPAILAERLARVPALGERERETIQAAVEQVVNIADPLQVILFGSRARGQGQGHSDIDLLVILPDGVPVRDLWHRMLEAVNGLQPVIDIVPTSQTGWAERSQLPFFVERYARLEGVTLYER